MPDLVSLSDEADGHVIDLVHMYVKLPFGFVRTKYLRIDMNLNWLILAAKHQIFLQTGIPEGNQLLFWAGNCLEELMTFQEYSMTSAQSYFVDFLIGLNGGVSEDDSALNGSARPRTVPRQRPVAWCFNFLLQMPAFSDPEEVRVACLQVLEAAKKKSAINGLAQSSFSYDVPGEGGLAKISGYLHVNKPANLTEATVRRWISDGRISGE